jgi:outer membrane protein assembly factor BamA
LHNIFTIQKSCKILIAINTICILLGTLQVRASISKAASENIFVKEVIISGLKLTKELVILRELSIKQNDILSFAALEKNFDLDKGRLTHLMLFKKVDGTITYLSPDTVIVKYSVAESFRYVIAPILQLSDRNFNTWVQMYNANIGRLNYGAYVQVKNINGLNQQLYIEFQNGFNRFYGLNYEVPRLKKYRNWGLGAKVNYMNVKNYPVDILDNKQRFHRNDSLRIFNEVKGEITASYKTNIYVTHKFITGVAKISISKDLLNENNNLFGQNQQQVKYLMAKYKFASIKTNSPVYPTIGTKIELEARYAGDPFSKSINKNMQSAVDGVFGYYKNLGKKVYLASHIRGQIGANNGAFYNTRALGYLANTVRTYEYYIIHGSHFAITRGDLKYKLLERVLYAPGKRIKQSLPFAIYPKVFVDFGYVYSTQLLNNALANTKLRSAGVGLDFHVNNNHALRLEYGVNHLKQKGLFLNFLSL